MTNFKGKKVCFVLSSLGAGGTERVVVTLAEYFHKKGIAVTIINLFRKERFFNLSPGIKIIEPILNRKGKNRFIYAICLIPYLRRNIKRINPSIIISHGEWFNPYVIFSTRFLPYKIFVADHLHPDLKFGIFLDFAKKILYKRATGIIVLTNYASEIIKKRTDQTRVFVIPNPINHINRIDCEIKNSIITVGRLSPEKGHKYLIEAFASLHLKDWYLNIIGDGPNRVELEALSVSLGVREHVVFHGYQKEFAKLLSESKLFVLPSLSENFPLALCEAMTVPLACISTDCTAGKGSDAIIEHGKNGILVKPGDVAELAEAIDLLVTDEITRKRIASEGYKIRERFNTEKIIDAYLRITMNDCKIN